MKNSLFLKLCLSLLVLASSSLSLFADEKTLQIACNLATNKFAGFKYGSAGLNKQQIDCVQFVLAVVEERVGQISPITKRDILIADNWTPEEEQKLAEQGTDPRLAGVQKALVDAGLGAKVEISNVKPGDLIQYWAKRTDDSWFGHAGVIKSVNSSKVVLLGAHQSKNGIAELTIDLGKVERAFLVRINSEKK